MMTLLPTERPMGKNAGFTLMELLVTISIIAVLAAILLPTVTTALKRADVAKARADVASLKNAVEAYYNVYHKYPSASGKQLVAELLGNNPREIQFLETDSGNPDGTFEDPWDQQYQVEVDEDYDGTINIYGKDRRLGVVAYSSGPDTRDDSETDPANQDIDDVYSFDEQNN